MEIVTYDVGAGSPHPYIFLLNHLHSQFSFAARLGMAFIAFKLTKICRLIERIIYGLQLIRYG